MFKANSAKGLTLVEVLASVIITGIIITAMFPFFASIQRKQLSGGNTSTLLQGAICSLETRRLHTLSRHSDNGNNRTTGLSIAAPKAPANQIGTLYDALRSETGYYAMSENDIMPFSVVGSFRGGSHYNDEIDFIYGNYTTSTGSASNTISYSSAPLMGYHRVFFFTTEMTALVSITKDEASRYLTKKFSPGTDAKDNGNLGNALKGARESGFGKYRVFHVFSSENYFSNAGSREIKAEDYNGVKAAVDSRDAILGASENGALKNKRLFRIFTHYIGGIYEFPSDDTGHYQ